MASRLAEKRQHKLAAAAGWEPRPLLSRQGSARGSPGQRGRGAALAQESRCGPTLCPPPPPPSHLAPLLSPPEPPGPNRVSLPVQPQTAHVPPAWRLHCLLYRWARRGTRVRAESSLTQAGLESPARTESSLGHERRVTSRVRGWGLGYRSSWAQTHQQAHQEARNLRVCVWNGGPRGRPKSSAGDGRACVGHTHTPLQVAAHLCVSTGSEGDKSKRLMAPNRTKAVFL